MRENKIEILCVYEDLKVKVYVVRDLLGRKYEGMNFIIDGKFDIECSNEVKSWLFSDFILENFNNNIMFLWFSWVECVKLFSLFFWLKEELVCERNLNNEGWVGVDDDDICFLYDNLESKFFWLLCEFVLREDEII